MPSSQPAASVVEKKSPSASMTPCTTPLVLTRDRCGLWAVCANAHRLRSDRSHEDMSDVRLWARSNGEELGGTGSDNVLGWDVRQPGSETRPADMCAAAPDRRGALAERPPSWSLSNSEWQSVAILLGLSDRQLRIAQCLFDGFDETSIGKELGVSHHTVHTHLIRLYRRLSVGNKSDLLVRVFLAHLSARRRFASREKPRVRRRHREMRPSEPVVTRVVSTARGQA